ncbi:MAG: rhomboid family intramembrane serine protease [Cyclobacteriaceae bacterium]|nr:rhomboid family intramembrane serine protease [Cyclobacteriaceae bacterium]
MSPLVNDRVEHLKFRYAVYMVISFALLLWIIKAIEIAADVSFSTLGVLPRTLKGTIGIITGPLIHGDIFHLISNTLPIILLGMLLFYFYHRIAVEIFIWIYLVTGFWTWMLARNAYHIGASGIVYGMASFLFFSGIIRKSKQLMTVSGIIIVLYGGIIYGIFPEMVEADVSWESHLMGALAGVLLAFFFRKTKIDFDKDNPDDDNPDEDSEENYFRHTSSTDSIGVRYIFKPKDKI